MSFFLENMRDLTPEEVEIYHQNIIKHSKDFGGNIFDNYKFMPINSDFGLILNCAVRYALGRMTYIPSSVISYITPVIQDVDDKTLGCFIEDIEQYDKDVQRGIGSWGMDYDKEDWLLFLDNCKKEKERRNKNGK